MSAAQERLLAKRSQAGSAAASQALASANIRLVVLLVLRLRRPDWIQLDDLVQEGTLGLMHAIGRFRPELGRFRPYAALWIRDAALQFIERSTRRETDQLTDEEAWHGDTPEAAILDAEASVVASMAISAAIQSLAPREASAMAGAMAGLPQHEIGRRIKRTKQSVSLLQRAARPKLERLVRLDRRARSVFSATP